MTKAEDIPPCSTDFCSDPTVRMHVNEICKQQHWPADHHVLVYDKNTGGFCYCTCGEASAAAKPNGGVKYCHSSECHLNPELVDMCQDFAPGQPVLIQNREGHYCYCRCWDGVLAPYKVANADGEQVPLDEVPVGGFVMATGLDIDWKKMLVRYATRPWQAAPQMGVKVTVNEKTMLVPTSHLFLTYQQNLILANQMIKAIALMGADGRPAVVEDIETAATTNVYQFLATADHKPPEDLRYHLLDSEGVVSADHAVQKAYQDRALPESLLAYPYDWDGAASDETTQTN